MMVGHIRFALMGMEECVREMEIPPACDISSRYNGCLFFPVLPLVSDNVQYRADDDLGQGNEIWMSDLINLLPLAPLLLLTTVSRTNPKPIVGILTSRLNPLKSKKRTKPKHQSSLKSINWSEQAPSHPTHPSPRHSPSTPPDSAYSPLHSTRTLSHHPAKP